MRHVQVRARFVERFSMGTGGDFKGMEDKISWVEKFMHLGASGMEAAQDEHSRSQSFPIPPFTHPSLANYSQVS